MSTKEAIMGRFSDALRVGLVNKFNRIPTAQKFSDEYNLRSINPISKETARKWINGITMPEPERLSELINWFNLNADYVFLDEIQDANENPVFNKIQLLRRAEQFARHALNFASPRIAIMDKHSNIIMVNEAWRSSAIHNPPLHRGALLCEGANYLDLLDNVKGEEEQMAKEMACNIRELLRNPEKKFIAKYPCHAQSPYVKHWFSAELSSYKEKENLCLVIAHHEISELEFLAKI